MTFQSNTGNARSRRSLTDFLNRKWRRLSKLWLPPIIPLLLTKLRQKRWTLPKLPPEYAMLPRGGHGLYKLLNDYSFDTVLDVGSGAADHAEVLYRNGKKVTALDFGTSIYAQAKTSQNENVNLIEVDFNKFFPEEKFDCIWASHVLEHQPDPGFFIRKSIDLVKEGGVIAITVPPLMEKIVGGHLTVWNAGLLLYQMVFNGLDCRNASICTYGYNITIIVEKKTRRHVDLTYDSGDIEILREFFPIFVRETFDGEIHRWNW